MTKRSLKRNAPRGPGRRIPAVRRKRDIQWRPLLKRGWWAIRGLAAGVLLVALLWGCWMGIERIVALPTLSIRAIQVEGCRAVTAESVVNLSGVSVGDPLLTVNLRQVRERIVSHPRIKDAAVVRHFPDTLSIVVRERIPVAVILQREYALLDGEGEVLARSSRYPGGYPLITGLAGDWRVGSRAVDALAALGILAALDGAGVVRADGVSEVRVEKDRVLVSLVDTGAVLVMSPDHPEDQVRRLARIVEGGLFDARAAGYDLRFEGRVIRKAARDAFVEGRSPGLPMGG